MNTSRPLVASLIAVVFSFASARAQPPAVSVDPKLDANLANAQKLITQAYSLLNRTQAAKASQLEGHAQNAMNLLSQANAEVKEAAIAELEYRARQKRAN